jgi:steroid delta-isomerase-like uncharacterized protein
MTDAVRQYAERASQAFNTRNIDALMALQAEDFVYADETGASRGHAETRAREAALFEAFPDIAVTMQLFAWTEDTLALDVTLTGTHTGPFAFGGQVAPPTGRRIETRMAAHFTFREGLAVAERAYYDRLALLAQLGLLGA